uniref:Uncharacterized protein n=1 Tax=Romanomermis culicivorax TaxID=13658 RepID=A0A915JCK3_ROMCU
MFQMSTKLTTKQSNAESSKISKFRDETLIRNTDIQSTFENIPGKIFGALLPYQSFYFLFNSENLVLKV